MNPPGNTQTWEEEYRQKYEGANVWSSKSIDDQISFIRSLLREQLEGFGEIKIENEQKIRNFILGMLGQYGKRWDEFTELQRATFNDDIDKLTKGIIYQIIADLREKLKGMEGKV